MRFATTPDRLLSDDVLVTRVAQGDANALETLYDRYAAVVLGMALKITKDQALAENILQETFWVAWKSMVMYQPERESFSSWLFKMARNLAVEACDRQR